MIETEKGHGIWFSFGLALHLLCIGAETPIPIQTITKQLQIQFCALSLTRHQVHQVRKDVAIIRITWIEILNCFTMSGVYNFLLY